MSPTILPTFFSVSRAIQYSDGVMLAVKEDASRAPITVREFSVRGAKSSHGDAYKLARGDAKTIKDINTPNPQRVDAAFLPQDAQRLRVSFSMNVLAVSAEQACNDFAYTGKLHQFLDAFKEADGFAEIARLLVWRIASAAVLWRNRYGSDKAVVVRSEGQEWTFDAETVSTRSPDGFEAPADLVACIAGALGGKRKVLMLDITTEVTLGYGQEVFPSQELEMKKAQDGKSKVLYAVAYGSDETAAMHPQKIGAAIRAFDIWHPEFDKAGPLSIEPLGYSHQHQKSFRTVDTGTDLYGYLQAIDELTQAIRDSGVDHRMTYLVACLMRGGVFSRSPDEKEKTAAKKGGRKAKAAPEEVEEVETEAADGFMPT